MKYFALCLLLLSSCRTSIDSVYKQLNIDKTNCVPHEYDAGRCPYVVYKCKNKNGLSCTVWDSSAASVFCMDSNFGFCRD